MRVVRVRYARDTRGRQRAIAKGGMEAEEQIAAGGGVRVARREGVRTWTLDALRAATEPVKEEAMQAILYVVCVWE